MPEYKGKHIIAAFQKKWKTKVILSLILQASAITILLSTLLHRGVLLSFWFAIPLFIIIFLVLFCSQQQWKVTEWDVSRFLNHHYPQLQESTDLILKPVESLNFLQKLQAERIDKALLQIEEPQHFTQKLRWSVYIVLIALILSFVLLKLPFRFNSNSHAANQGDFTSTGSSSMPEKILPEISSVNVKITPPAYTRKATKEQSKFNLAVEEGAEVDWNLTTNAYADKLKMLFNDRQVLNLRPVNKEHTVWVGGKAFNKPGFYQVAINNKISEFYKIEVIKDLPPVIHIQTPAPHTVIDFGMPEKVGLTVALSDDYGIQNTSVSATISSGSGEAVKFKEQQLAFENFKAGGVKYNLQKLLDLKALGMQPGDELYFYVRAIDTHNQERRSDVYIITLPDTAQLMSMEGMVTSIDLKPEYFRSERQIIIETEQLIKDKDTLSTQEFNNRSNNLGIDQKLLRLRYGKFLGEESETEIGEHADGEETEHNEGADLGNAAKIIDPFTHKHDNSEDATFFEPELKSQLKATLTEMWKAELQLRINKPHDALPFEYKALRLLKDLQQKSRVYVAKTGFKATPLKPEKRLTGELDKITQPVNQQTVDKKKDADEASRKAIGLLEMLQTKKELSASSIETLQEASQQLYNNAANQPAVYLPAVAAMKRILTAISNHTSVKASDISLAEKGLQRMLSVPAKLPSAASKASYKSLSADYFKNLNKRTGQ